jgi:phosphoglycolate phosphatase-like HAD superfamily hydrolase
MLSAATLVFWDFDGVIKDSVEVKSTAFENLFSHFGKDIASRVRLHHESHGGVSRFEKIPLYLTWANEPATPAKVEEYCDRFSSFVLQAVISSPWVPGVREYLLLNSRKHNFVLVTATPQDEINQIIAALDMSHCFSEIHGAPKHKASAIKDVLARLKCAPANALMIGDSETDLKAAQESLVPFLLRRTSFNQPLQASYSGPMFADLNNE